MNMAFDEEENFPRGGTKSRSSLKRPKENNNLFSINKVKSKKSNKSKKAKRNHNENATESFHASLKLQGTLSYNRIQDGMVISGCIRNITGFSIEVALPGLIFGYVKITNISDPLTKSLGEKVEAKEETDMILKNMFRIGQFVIVKVLSMENKEKKVHVECTMNPREINHEKSHSSFKKGMLAWASVQSVLDHGYEINIGVKNCRVFLPSKNVEEGNVFIIGEPLLCVIHKSESTSAATTLRVSSKEQHIYTSPIEEITSLHNLLPGMQIQILTEKVTSNGIQGKFINDYLGYIDESQLLSPLHTPDHYKEGKLLNAYVLYVEPTTKVTYLTMRNLSTVPSRNYKDGDIVPAEVISKQYNGIYFKLSPNEKCFVSNNRIINSLPKNSNTNLADVIKKKFTPGSSHTCRILDYNYVSSVYVGTVEQSVIKEKLFNSKDVQAGQLLIVTIDCVKAGGLVVSCGKLRGFAPNLYLSNVKYSDNIKKKFKEHQKVNARVLHVTDDGNIIFTLKAGQVESDKCLTSLNDAERGDSYTGVVVQTYTKGALVIFYNNIKGWLGRKYLVGPKTHENPDPVNFFYVGQVVNTWILGVKDGKVLLSLNQPSEFKTHQILRIGQTVKGFVQKIYKNKIDVKSKNEKLLGYVPVNHLSCSLSLCPFFLNTFKVGDEINDLLCIDNRSQPNVLSRREAKALVRSDKSKLLTFEKLKPGVLIRCSFVSTCESGIYVSPLILDYKEDILINNKDIVSEQETLPRFQKDQCIVVKILDVNVDSKTLSVTAKFNEVFDSRVETTMALFKQQLADAKYLKNFGRQNDWELCQYQTGQRIECRVEKLGNEGGCLVILPNDVQGLVTPRLCLDNAKVGQNVEGVFLDVDFKYGYTEICLKPDICQKINKIQDGLITYSNLANCISENVMIRRDSAICVLKQDEGNRQLVYIPLYLHENDYQGFMRYYERTKVKLCICGKTGNTLVGVSKKLFLTLEKQRRFMEETSKKSHIKKKKQTKIKSKYRETKSSEIGMEIAQTESEEETIDSEKQMVATKRTVKRKLKADKNLVTPSSPDLSAPLPVLSGISSFFHANENGVSESSSEEDDEVETAKKKKKLSPAERLELAKQENERILKIEEELADNKKTPESAEQFDRALSANPNSSELWTRYMSFYIAATEIDKARTVGKRALESIDMALMNERYNIWIALLNIENMFGTKEQFDKTFEEALRYNDSLEIYLKAIEMLAKTEKFGDMEEKILKVKKKYKQEPKMWLEVAKVYYQIDKFKEARNFKVASLKSIDDKKTQIQIILRFAIMEFKFGEEEQGAAIFETMLSSDPRRVNIWTAYVDQLVKKERVEEARRVLQRSVCQRLPMKSMKTLFMKFKSFEEQHGTPESVQEVIEKSKEFVSKLINR